MMNRLKRQLFQNFCVAFVFSIVSLTSLGQRQGRSVIGIVDKSVQMKCELNISDPADVQWEDKVYNVDRNAILIFNSTNNTDFTISPLHPNNGSYEVNSDFTLTINLLNLEDDAGEYICRSNVNNASEEQFHYLTVVDLPKCSANTQLTDGQETNYTCLSTYSGNHPRLTWFRGDTAIESKDDSETRLAKQVVHWNASYKDDKQKFTCKMILDEFNEECSFYLDVTFLVRDITFVPHKKEKYQSGEEIRCTAKGNPAPKILFEPSTSPGKSMDGSKTITIPKAWEGKEVTLTCTATNSLGTKEHVETRNITISVAEAVGTERKLKESLDKALDNTPVVIGAIIIVALVLLVIIIAVVLVRTHQQKQRQKAAKQKAAREQENGRKSGKVDV